MPSPFPYNVPLISIQAEHDLLAILRGHFGEWCARLE